MSAKEIERKPERIPNQHEYMPKKKETNDSKNKELLKKAVCYGCGQTGHMAKDKDCPKNNKDKKKTTTQMYAVEERVEVLEVPIVGRPITTDEVSIQMGDRGKCYIMCI